MGRNKKEPTKVASVRVSKRKYREVAIAIKKIAKKIDDPLFRKKLGLK